MTILPAYFTTCFTIAWPLLLIWQLHRRSAFWRRARLTRLAIGLWLLMLLPTCQIAAGALLTAAQVQPYMMELSENAVPGAKPLRVSWYNPALGGVNCDHDCSRMASGVFVTADRYGRTAACVPEWTKARRVVVIPSLGRFDCLDTGGAIREYPGYIWIDLMLSAPAVPFGALVYDWHLE